VRPPSASILVLLAAVGFAASAQELVRNGTFDRDLSRWTYYESRWVPDDARDEPGSGSARNDRSSVRTLCNSGSLRQCVPVRPGSTYRLSLYELGVPGGYVGAQWFTSNMCTTGALEPSVQTYPEHDH
jgi:hypothetical protein